MKKTVLLIIYLLVLLVITLVWVSCSSDDPMSRLEVRLMDAPGDFDAVNIDIQGVEVHRSGDDQQSGWMELNVQEGVYDLLQLTNGLDTLLGAVELPAGKVSQIRLILGDNNSIMVDSVVYDLATPSAQQSGLKLNLHADLVGGITYTVTLDFDVARSVVENGNGEYSLKPVIRAVADPTSGAITGTVTPLTATPAVYALMGTDTVATTFTDSTGVFLLRGLEPGTYTVTFVPSEGFLPQEKDNVIVTLGNVTNVGVIEFP